MNAKSEEPTIDPTEPALVDNAVNHPRILLLKGEEAAIRHAMQDTPELRKVHDAMLEACDSMLSEPPLERVMIGRRLLGTSRELLRRVFFLSYAWRMTGQDKYAVRAEQEMLTAASFTDWNPAHFLDVAEMTMGMAIGYDWLFDRLSAASRQQIREAIIKKGLEPSLNSKFNGFLGMAHNWNQVCNAGMTFGALAVQEDHPALAWQIINRAIRSIPRAMAVYGPDGAYPEGYMYWGYGTSFNVLFLNAVEKAFGTDFGLVPTPGFLKTGQFMEHMRGVSGQCFNWSDCHPGGGLNPTLFWFAQRTGDASLLWMEIPHLQQDAGTAFVHNRLLPAMMIWGQGLETDKVTMPRSLVWTGRGENPVCLMRTSWNNPNGIFLGLKAGSPSVNHAHMDVGSFVMEAQGVRWATHLGMQDYHAIESKGIDLWRRTQDGQRWTILRLNNRAHNTLTIDNQLQQVAGHADIERSGARPGFAFAVTDLSSVYAGQLASTRRGAAIVNDAYVVLRDELHTTDRPTTVRWALLTGAEAVLSGERTIRLTRNDKQLHLLFKTPEGMRLKTWSTDPGTDYDAPNPGTLLVGCEGEVPAHTSALIQVMLIPGPEPAAWPEFAAGLDAW